MVELVQPCVLRHLLTSENVFSTLTLIRVLAHRPNGTLLVPYQVESYNYLRKALRTTRAQRPSGQDIVSRRVINPRSAFRLVHRSCAESAMDSARAASLGESAFCALMEPPQKD